ncbi:hypothetical protein GCM10023259_015430 [Thermocatellispora tengchongensis]
MHRVIRALEEELYSRPSSTLSSTPARVVRVPERPGYVLGPAC